MEEECEIVAEVEKPSRTSPSVRKLKQSRLSFVPMSSPAVSPLTQKKRKLSVERGGSPKTPRNENLLPEREPELKLKKNNETKLKEPNPGQKKRGRPPLKENVVKEKRKRGRPKKTSAKPSAGKNKKLEPSSLLSDDEVSSSVDDESVLPRAKKKNLEITGKLLGGLYREPTQEAKISTSTTAGDGEDREEEEDKEMLISSKRLVSKSLDKKVGVKEAESPSKKNDKRKTLKRMKLIDLKMSSSEEEEEEELEISRKKETEEDSTNPEEEHAEATENKKQDLKEKDSSNVEKKDNNLEKKKKRGLPSGKKGNVIAKKAKGAGNGKKPEDSSDIVKSYPKKTDTKADTKRNGKKRTRKGMEECMRVKKSKLDNEEEATCDKKGLEEEEREDNGSPRKESDEGSVREEEDKEDCWKEEKSGQSEKTGMKEKEVTQQDKIAKNLDNADDYEKRDLEKDEDESENENSEDKSKAQNNGSENEETEESETDIRSFESHTSTPGTGKKVKPAGESNGREEKSGESKRGKKVTPKGDKTGKGKQEDGKSIDARGKSKHGGITTQECVVSITRFFSPAATSEGTRRKSLGSGKKNHEEDERRKESNDNAVEEQDKGRKEDEDSEGKQAEEKEIVECGNKGKKQPENREAMHGKGSEKPVEEKEVVTDDGTSKQKKMNNSEEDEQQMDENTDKESGDMCLSPSTCNSPTAAITVMNSKVLTPMTAVGPPKRKLTPKQKSREEELQRKRLEREKKKQEEQAEKERKRKEEQAERERKKKEELAEKEKKKKEKEEERIKLKEEKEKMKEEQKKKKQEELDAKRQIKEEEKQRKEEEKLKKEEAKKQAEEEKNKQKEKLKNKFASFFVSKRREVEEEEDEDSGLFKQFRIKEDMRLAPLHRSQLTSDQISKLDLDLSNPDTESSTSTYLEVLRTKEYVKGSSKRTWPRKKAKDVENDVEVIEEEDDEEEDPEEAALDGAVMQDLGNIALPMGSRGRAKLLHFCDNRRPAYWGTWSKKSIAVSGRRPFAKDTVFDYEYDSDDDWEEEETGESLSDSEGEDKEEEEDQYEVDNDFFVPHGYLSDDEAVTDQEEDMEQEKDDVPQVDGERNLKLKQKQAEFDKEMKRKTRELKPRLIGCLWLADENNPAYHQLLKVLNPYKAVALCPLPVDTRVKGPVWVGRELEERDQEEDRGSITEDKKPRFYRMFPEEAVPSLIRLLHGNRNGKLFLTNEFRDYHKKQCKKDEMQLSRKKVEMKLKELGQWCKCPDQGPMHNVMMWYVPKETRKKYGLEDLTLPNTWTYINTPKTQDDTQQQQAAGMDDTGSSRTPKHQPITAFTKKIMPGTTHSPSLSATPVRVKKQELKTPKNLSITSFTKKITSGASPSSTNVSAMTPSPSRIPPSTSASTTTPQSKSNANSSPGNNQASESSPSVSKEQMSGNKPGRKRRSLTNSQGATPIKSSIVSFFKKDNSKGESSPKTKSPVTVGSCSQEEMDCVTID